MYCSQFVGLMCNRKNTTKSWARRLVFRVNRIKEMNQSIDVYWDDVLSHTHIILNSVV